MEPETKEYDRYRCEMLKKRPSLKELEESYKFEEILSFSDFCFYFYYALINTIADDLSAKFYTIEELEQVIPNIDSPYYDKSRVKLKYMEIMAQRKYRGEDWNTEIALLKSSDY